MATGSKTGWSCDGADCSRHRCDPVIGWSIVAPVVVLPEFLPRDIDTDDSSACDPLYYIPERAQASMVGFMDKGAEVFD